MKVGSLFSGGGGGDHGLVAAGHQLVFGCEIDKHARSVLRYHNPDLHIYTDVREVTRERLESDGIRIPDLIIGGSPCQDLSVIGNVVRVREGLDGERSGLFREQCRIADELGIDWVVWENVAGALSSNKGHDFAEVIHGLSGFRPTVPAKGWRNSGVAVGPKRSLVWRVLDAQYFGVPQRRRRIFIVCGPRGMAQRVVEVLFEPESCNWDSAPSKNARKETSAGASERLVTDSGGGLGEIAQCLLARYGSRGDLDTESFVLDPMP